MTHLAVLLLALTLTVTAAGLRASTAHAEVLAGIAECPVCDTAVGGARAVNMVQAMVSRPAGGDGWYTPTDVSGYNPTGGSWTAQATTDASNMAEQVGSTPSAVGGELEATAVEATGAEIGGLAALGPIAIGAAAVTVWAHDGAMLWDYFFGGNDSTPPTGAQGSGGWLKPCTDLSQCETPEVSGWAHFPAARGAVWQYEYGGAWERVDQQEGYDSCSIGMTPPSYIATFSNTFWGGSSSCPQTYSPQSGLSFTEESRAYYTLDGTIPAGMQWDQGSNDPAGTQWISPAVGVPTRAQLATNLDTALKTHPMAASAVQELETGTIIIPQPTPNEVYTDYETQLQRVGIKTTPKVVTLDTTNEDPTQGPNAVVQVSPAPGTAVQPSTEVTIEANPDTAPAGTVAGGAPGAPTIPGITVPSVATPCSVFPFGIPCWLGNQLSAFVSTSPQAPVFDIPLPNVVCSTDPNCRLHIDLGNVFGFDTSTVMGLVRPVLLAISLIGLVVWLGGMAMGGSTGGGGGAEADE